jgi:hypothetical protein
MNANWQRVKQGQPLTARVSRALIIVPATASGWSAKAKRVAFGLQRLLAGTMIKAMNRRAIHNHLSYLRSFAFIRG